MKKLLMVTVAVLAAGSYIVFAIASTSVHAQTLSAPRTLESDVDGDPTGGLQFLPNVRDFGSGPWQPLSGRETVPAPIDSLGVTPYGAAPTGHALQIVAGLPNGCARAHAFGFERSGNFIEAYVTNTVPATNDVACTLMYRSYDVTIDLGSDFVPGSEYTARVNDRVITFTAHGDVTPTEKMVGIGEPFALRVGETATLQANQWSVTFVDVTEDSRCPADVWCVWAGEAVLNLRVDRPDGTGEDVALRFGAAEPPSVPFDTYDLAGISIEPSARLGSTIPQSEYVTRLQFRERTSATGVPGA